MMEEAVLQEVSRGAADAVAALSQDDDYRFWEALADISAHGDDALAYVLVAWARGIAVMTDLESAVAEYGEVFTGVLKNGDLVSVDEAEVPWPSATVIRLVSMVAHNDRPGLEGLFGAVMEAPEPEFAKFVHTLAAMFLQCMSQQMQGDS